MAELKKKAEFPITILKAQEFKYNRDKYNHLLWNFQIISLNQKLIFNRQDNLNLKLEVRANLIPSAFLNYKNLIIYAKLAGARPICQFHKVGTKNQSTSLDSLLTFFNIKIETL